MTSKTKYVFILDDMSLTNISTIDDIWSERLLKGVKRDFVAYEAPYSKIPNTFKSLKEWPISTNLKCWQCTRTFNVRPIPMPDNIRSCGSAIEISTSGNYCSFNCLIAITRKITDKAKRQQLENNIANLVKIFIGITNINIQPALPPTVMDCYGGSMTQEEYNTYMDNINIDIVVNNPIIREIDRPENYVAPVKNVVAQGPINITNFF